MINNDPELNVDGGGREPVGGFPKMESRPAERHYTVRQVGELLNSMMAEIDAELWIATKQAVDTDTRMYAVAMAQTLERLDHKVRGWMDRQAYPEHYRESSHGR